MAVNAKTLIAKLSGEESAHRRAFLALAVDHTLEEPLSTFLYPDELAKLLVDVLTDTNAEALIEREIGPARARTLAHFQETGETPRDILPADLPDQVVEIISRGERPRAEWARGAVDPAPLRALLAPIVQNVLMSFAKKLPIPGLQGEAEPAPQDKRGGGLGASLRKRAGSIADMGKAALGGISGEIERKLQVTVREFSQQALTEVRGAIRERLQSDEGRKVTRELRAALVERFLDTPIHVLLEDGDRAPVDELLALAPAIVAHNRVRPQLRSFIEREIAFYLERDGATPIGELLDVYELREPLKARLLDELDPPVTRFIQSEGFERWLGDLLKG